MSLCRFNNMEKCAQQYCDFWNNKEKMCTIALEIHNKVELLQHLNTILEKLEKTDKKKVMNDLRKYINNTYEKVQFH